ncbi:hypothetical protein IE4872_PD01612 (plasmid) [Rhizobium gallicum]|uniref:Uncharacterized protein n=2 Tax=Rhizobium/Agrobacterium group TaxID=227290 RepID=A0A1L5NW40_9HYPH|nr:hypothetical protein IE4872_PD01612 [Rhizobium gallicum]
MASKAAGLRTRRGSSQDLGVKRRVRSDQGPTSSREGAATVRLHARRAAATFRSGRLMSHGIITEIRDARKELLSLSIKDRERLVRRIVDELHAVRTSDFSDSPFASSTGLDYLVARTYDTIPEIARMDDKNFGMVLDQFVELLETITSIVRLPPTVLH